MQIEELLNSEEAQRERDRLVYGIQERKEALSTTLDRGEQYVKIMDQLIHWETELKKFDELPRYAETVMTPLVSDRDCQRVDIVILKYKDPTVEKRCFQLINEHTDWPYRITWFDNRYPFDHSIATANFAMIWNRLIRESVCDYVLVMDSDAFVAKDWLSTLMSSFQKGFTCCLGQDNPDKIEPDKVGLVVPVTHRSGASTIQGMHRNDLGVPFLTQAQVSGFFFLLKKEMFENIGPFDERFYLHGQDSEWIDRIIESGWQIVVRTDVYIDHAVSASIRRAEEKGEIDLQQERLYTKIIYDAIRREKEQGTYIPYATGWGRP